MVEKNKKSNKFRSVKWLKIKKKSKNLEVAFYMFIYEKTLFTKCVSMLFKLVAQFIFRITKYFLW